MSPSLLRELGELSTLAWSRPRHATNACCDAMQGGGGGQFAIITQFKMKVYQQPTGLTATSISYSWNLTKARAVDGLAWCSSAGTHTQLAHRQWLVCVDHGTIMQTVRVLPLLLQMAHF